MASKTSRIRNSLNSLWKTVLGDSMSENLGVNSTVSHDFLKSDTEFGLSPMISIPLKFKATIHPYCLHPVPRTSLMSIRSSQKNATIPDMEIRSTNSTTTSPVGNGWNTRVLASCLPLSSSLGIYWLSAGGHNTHRLSFRQERYLPREHRVPHEILLDEGFTMTTGNMNWEADIYEYDIDFWGEQHPHVILLSYHSDIGHENSIMHGELAQLVTAARNRAHEPEMVEVSEDELYENDEAEMETLFPEGSPLVFQYEQRFPVLMVSLVGLQNGCIYYACMDGLDVVIRQSSLFSFEKRETAPWDFFPGSF
ncbi:hypothetical protein PISL3812_00536 [Talaromyces islandicus]|uniref:Uncharacterized protein n=1 Tax=Talaromyces islandicus TaxID=28573 RepID=A0A0U1LLA7_TALIS|nr:hypothetical protein PISL3812_00536 [Talaromyces islandicus]